MDDIDFFPALEKIIQISGSFGRFVRSFLGEWKSDFFSPNETETHKTVADQTMFERSSKCILTLQWSSLIAGGVKTRKINEFLGLNNPWVQVEMCLLIC
jgi:hypothetical protein